MFGSPRTLCLCYNIHKDILLLGAINITTCHSKQLPVGLMVFNGFWWYCPLSEDREFLKTNLPKLSCGFKLHLSINPLRRLLWFLGWNPASSSFHWAISFPILVIQWFFATITGWRICKSNGVKYLPWIRYYKRGRSGTRIHNEEF